MVYAGGAEIISDFWWMHREMSILPGIKQKQNPERRKDTYYAEPGISKEAQAEIKKILWNERMKSGGKKRCRKDERVVFASHNHLVIDRAKPGTPCLL